MIAAKSIDLIEKNRLFEYKLFDRIVAIELIDSIKETKATSLEFLYLFENFEIADKSSEINRTIESI